MDSSIFMFYSLLFFSIPAGMGRELWLLVCIACCLVFLRGMGTRPQNKGENEIFLVPVTICHDIRRHAVLTGGVCFEAGGGQRFLHSHSVVASGRCSWSLLPRLVHG